MTNIKGCKWNGIEYATYKEASADSGHCLETLWYYINKKGYSCDDDIPDMSGTWNGVQYKNAAIAGRANNISRNAMSARWRKGYISDDDLTPHGSPDFHMFAIRRVCVWNNIEYPSLTEAAKAHNITVPAMQKRMDNGYTQDSDLNIVGRKKWAKYD